MENNLEAQVWREKTNKLIESLNTYINSGKLSIDQLADFITGALRAAVRNERFENPLGLPSLDYLLHYLQLAMTIEGGIVMIPLQVSLLRSGQLSIEELVEYLHESALISLNIEDSTSPKKHSEADEKVEEEFNALLDDIEELADEENYSEAIKLIDKAFAIADKEPLLFYDKCTLINNRGFYNYKLGNLKEALADVDKAIEENPDDDLPYYTKAEVLFEMKNYSASLEAINKAIQINPDSDKEDFRKLILEKI